MGRRASERQCPQTSCARCCFTRAEAYSTHRSSISAGTAARVGQPGIFDLDAIYYGANLKDYFEREFGDHETRNRAWPDSIKQIPFWSDLVKRFAQRRPT